jgi:hypothetical protein
LKWSDDASQFGRGFIIDLENIAHIIRVCVPPAAMGRKFNGEEAPCPVHGEWSVGDPGLARQLLGRLGHASSEGSPLALEVVGGDGCGSGGCSLVDMLVRSIKRCAAAPWLLPLNRCYFEADDGALEHIIREDARRCLTFVHGSTECVAVVGRRVTRGVIHVYNLESGDSICALHEEGRA